MPRKCVCILVVIFALGASRSAQSQVTIDVTKLNCDQFVHHKISEPRLIAAWLSGYYNAKRDNRVLDLQTFEQNMSNLQRLEKFQGASHEGCRTGIGQKQVELDAQAIFCRRLHQPRRPPLAKIRPGRPAPATEPETLGNAITVPKRQAC